MTNGDKDKTSIYRDIKGIIWDLDNTLYRAHAELHEAYHLATARVAVRDGVEQSMDVALAKAKKSYEESEFSGRFLIREHGYDVPRLHFELHEMIDETAIVKSREVTDLFRQLGLKNALVTHGSQGWAHRVLTHLDLIEFFDHDAILSLESFDFQRKNESGAGVEMALGQLNMKPTDVIMAEDIFYNLEIPHKSGMFTTFIHHGQPPEDIPNYVDESYNSALDLLSEIADSRA